MIANLLITVALLAVLNFVVFPQREKKKKRPEDRYDPTAPDECVCRPRPKIEVSFMLHGPRYRAIMTERDDER